MKKSIKLLSLLLALLMLASVALTGCDSGSGTETQATETTSSAVAESTEIKLVENGKTVFTVIRPEECETGAYVITAAKNVMKAMAKYAPDTELSTDWVRKGEERSSETYEILVGLTVSRETLEVQNAMNFGDYAVKAVGNKIVILGFTDEALQIAENKFIEVLEAAAAKGDGQNVTIQASDLEFSGTCDEELSVLPNFENGTFIGTSVNGNDCTQLIIKSTTLDAYNAYVEKLKGLGYTVSRTNEVKDNSFATLDNGSLTINIGYYGYDNKVRIITEKYSEATMYGLEKDNNYNVVTTTQITMLGLEYAKEDGTYASNGLSVVIRLADGRFIIIDGGFNTATHYNNLLNVLKTQSQDYAAANGGITVAAWIVTHAHGDHVNLLNGKAASFVADGVKVQKLIANVASDEQLALARSTYPDNWSEGEGGASSKLAAVATAFGCDYVVPHTGMKYYIANLECEVLYTIESYAPAVINAFNTTSVVMKMTFTDPTTGEKTVYMSTGDCTGPAFSIIVSMYGDYLKSDLVQVAHHGYQTWSMSNATKAAYKLMLPTCLVWDVGFAAYESKVKPKDYNQPLYDLAQNPNYKETLVAGTCGDTVVIPLPYKVGTAIETRVK